MPVVRELLTRWGFDVDDKAVDRFNSKLESAKKVAKVATTAILAAGAAAGALVVQLTNSGDKIAKVSRQLGISTDDYQKLAYAAGLGGSSQEELVGSLRVLSRTMDEAHSKAGEQRKSFEELGISVTDASGKMRPTVDVLMDIADNFKSTEGGAQKTAAALKLFGRGGMSMVTALEGGSEGLQEMMREADALGIVMDQRLLGRTEAMSDELARLKAVGKSVGIMIGSELLPYVLQAAQTFVKWWKANKEFISIKVAEWADGAAKAFSKIADVFDRLGGFEGILNGLIEAVKILVVLKLASWFAAAAPAIVAFIASLDAASIMAAVNPIYLLAAAIASIIVYKDEMQLGFEMFFAAIPRAINVVADKVLSFVEVIVNAWQDFVEMLSEGGAALGIMDKVEYSEFKLERPQLGMTDEELRGVYGPQMGDKEYAERTKKPKEIVGVEVGAPEFAAKKIKVSPEELRALTGFRTPSTREFARLGSQGQLVTGPIDIGNNITIQLPAGATLQDAEQVKKFVAPVVRQELQRAARELQADLETQ
jgi:hypothetical protein